VDPTDEKYRWAHASFAIRPSMKQQQRRHLCPFARAIDGNREPESFAARVAADFRHDQPAALRAADTLRRLESALACFEP